MYLELRTKLTSMLLPYHMDQRATITDLQTLELRDSKGYHSGELQEHELLLVYPFIGATPGLVHVYENANCLPQGRTWSDEIAFLKQKTNAWINFHHSGLSKLSTKFAVKGYGDSLDLLSFCLAPPIIWLSVSIHSCCDQIHTYIWFSSDSNLT